MINSTENISEILPSISSLDKRVKVQTFTTSRDVNGAEIITWVDLRTDWAKVDYINTGNFEAYIGEQQMNFYRVKVTMRYRGDVTEKMRFMYNIDGSGEIPFDIQFKETLGRRKFEVFTCVNKA